MWNSIVSVFHLLLSQINVGLKSLLNQGLSEREFNGYLVYKFRKMFAGKIITHYKKKQKKKKRIKPECYATDFMLGC